MPWAKCPKCSSTHAWYQEKDRDIFLRCLCGYCRVVQTSLQKMTLFPTERGKSLPRPNTKLWDCLMMLFGLEDASTQEVTDRLNLNRRCYREQTLSVSEVSTQLTVLRFKGLVVPIDMRKGLPGGSNWVLTSDARSLIDLKGN